MENKTDMSARFDVHSFSIVLYFFIFFLYWSEVFELYFTCKIVSQTEIRTPHGLGEHADLVKQYHMKLEHVSWKTRIMFAATNECGRKKMNGEKV